MMKRRIPLNILCLAIVSFNLNAMDNINIKPEAEEKTTQQNASSTGTQKTAPESFFKMLTHANANALNACDLIENAGNDYPIQKRNYSLHDMEIALFLISHQLKTIDRNPSFHTNDERNWYIRAKEAITSFQKSIQPIASESAARPTSASSSSVTTDKYPASQSNNASNEINDTELMFASESGSIDSVKQFIAAGANVNATATNGKTALMFAIKNNHTAIVKILIAAHANVNATRHNGATPLMYAAHFGNAEITTILLKENAYIDATTSGSKDTALMYAAKNGHAAIVELLLDYGANVKMLNNQNETAYDVVRHILNTLNARPTYENEALRTKLNAVERTLLKYHANITGKQVIAEKQQQAAYPSNLGSTASASSSCSTTGTSVPASTSMSSSSQKSTSSATAEPLISEDGWGSFVLIVNNETGIIYNKYVIHEARDIMALAVGIHEVMALANLTNQLFDLYQKLGKLNNREAFINAIKNIIINNLVPFVSVNNANNFRTDIENALRKLLERNDVISKLQGLFFGFKLKAAAEVIRFNNHHDDNNDSGASGAMSSHERKQWQKAVKIKPDSFTNSHAVRFGLTALMTLGTTLYIST